MSKKHSFLNNQKGTYRGVGYQWQDRDGDIYIVCTINGEKKELKMGKGYDDPEYDNIYHACAEMHIDFALEEAAFEERALEYERLLAET